MRTVWVNDSDVEGQVEAGRVVTAARALDDWCLRTDDGSAPVKAGTLLEIVELRPWGKAMAQELPALHADESEGAAIMQAMVELEAEGLWEFAPAEARG